MFHAIPGIRVLALHARFGQAGGQHCRQVYALGEGLQAGPTLCKLLRNHAIYTDPCIALAKDLEAGT